MATTHPTPDAPAFTGEFRHKIEGKGRLTVPSAWRFAEEVELFMIKRSAQKCIGVMPRAELDRQKAVASAEMTASDRAKFLDGFGRKLRQVTLDKAGRITIPEELCREFGIEREVWLSGSIDTFNIWNVTDFEAQRDDGDDVMRRLGI